MRKTNSNNKLNESPSASSSSNSMRYPSLEFAVSSQQGMRPYQEDEVAIQSYNSIADSADFYFEETKGFNEATSIETFLFGIFDGHAGGKCSKYVSTHLPEALCSDIAFTSNLAVALRRSFHNVNDEFLQIAERQKLNDGSTGLCVVIRQDRLTVSNVGDCRAVLLSNNCQRVTQLSIDQKPNSPKEKNRIISLGGYVQNCYGVFRVNGVLAVARAFGNRVLRQVIRPDAEITVRRLERDDDFIIIASDGLWDVLSNRDVLQICKSSMNQSQQKIANELTSTAIKRGSMDNVTAIVINLSKYVLIMPRSSITPKGSPSVSPHTIEEKTKQDNSNNLNSPSFENNHRLSPLGSNFGATTTFSNQWQDRTDRSSLSLSSSLRPIPLRPQTTQSNHDNNLYRHALLSTQQHNQAESSSSSSNGHNNNNNTNESISRNNRSDNNNLKRSVNISSFDEFYNKQMAATKYSYNRNKPNSTNSYENGNSTISNLRSSLQEIPSNNNNNNNMARTTPLRRPHTSSSSTSSSSTSSSSTSSSSTSSSTINNSINKLNLSDEYIRTTTAAAAATSSSSSASRMYNNNYSLNKSDFFPLSTTSSSFLRQPNYSTNSPKMNNTDSNSNGTVVRSSSAFRPRSAALSTLK